MDKSYSITCCPCGQLSLGEEWKHPAISLAEFLSHMRKRKVVIIRLLSVTCPDCFEAKGLGVYATVEAVATGTEA